MTPSTLFVPRTRGVAEGVERRAISRRAEPDAGAWHARGAMVRLKPDTTYEADRLRMKPRMYELDYETEAGRYHLR